MGGLRSGEDGGEEGMGVASSLMVAGPGWPPPSLPAVATSSAPAPPLRRISETAKEAKTHAKSRACVSLGRRPTSYSTAELRVRPEISDTSLWARSSRVVGGRGESMGYSSGSSGCRCGGITNSPPYDAATSSCSPLATRVGYSVASFFRVFKAYFINASSAGLA